MENKLNFNKQTSDLQQLSDQEVCDRTQWLAQEERRITLEFLHHLAELSSRKLHLQKGYSSLFSYLTEELKYSEGAAHRRIQSMKALKAVPVLEGALLDGTVSITSAAKLQNHFQEKAKLQKAYSPAEKLELFQKIEGKSTREAEAMIEDFRLEMAGQAGITIFPDDKEKSNSQRQLTNYFCSRSGAYGDA